MQKSRSAERYQLRHLGLLQSRWQMPGRRPGTALRSPPPSEGGIIRSTTTIINPPLWLVYTACSCRGNGVRESALDMHAKPSVRFDFLAFYVRWFWWGNYVNWCCGWITVEPRCCSYLGTTPAMGCRYSWTPFVLLVSAETFTGATTSLSTVVSVRNYHLWGFF